MLGPESDINTSRVVVERLMHSINEMVSNKGHGDIVSASIGIASFPEDGMTADTLISNADAAMYMAKKNGKNCFQFYNN
ncbi:MAG: GGDEF domain-containing protein [Gammaproteobacteria bacterium]|nr:GGDEF domain-containing protein [Gammaproteobacteria bacterium]